MTDFLHKEIAANARSNFYSGHPELKPASGRHRKSRGCRHTDGRKGLVLWASKDSAYWFGVPYDQFDFAVVLANLGSGVEAFYVPGGLLGTGYQAADQLHFHLRFEGGNCWVDASGRLIRLEKCPAVIT